MTWSVRKILEKIPQSIPRGNEDTQSRWQQVDKGRRQVRLFNSWSLQGIISTGSGNNFCFTDLLLQSRFEESWPEDYHHRSRCVYCCGYPCPHIPAGFCLNVKRIKSLLLFIDEIGPQCCYFLRMRVGLGLKIYGVAAPTACTLALYRYVADHSFGSHCRSCRFPAPLYLGGQGLSLPSWRLPTQASVR